MLTHTDIATRQIEIDNYNVRTSKSGFINMSLSLYCRNKVRICKSNIWWVFYSGFIDIIGKTDLGFVNTFQDVKSYMGFIKYRNLICCTSEIRGLKNDANIFEEY